MCGAQWCIQNEPDIEGLVETSSSLARVEIKKDVLLHNHCSAVVLTVREMR